MSARKYLGRQRPGFIRGIASQWPRALWPHFVQVEKHDNGRIAHRRIVPGEAKTPCLLIHPESGDVVGPLIARIKKRARRVEREAARVIAARPFFADKSERS